MEIPENGGRRGRGRERITATRVAADPGGRVACSTSSFSMSESRRRRHARHPIGSAEQHAKPLSIALPCGSPPMLNEEVEQATRRSSDNDPLKCEPAARVCCIACFGLTMLPAATAAETWALGWRPA